MSVITVLGTGAIGTAAARALLGAGREVHVWNRTPARAEELVADGALREKDLAAAVRSGDLVLISLADHQAVQGLLAELPEGGGAGRTAVVLTTGSPEEVARTVSLAASRSFVTLAAGVQAAPEDVGTTRALFLYGGDGDAYERCRGDLDVLGSGRWMGPMPTAAAELDLALFGLWYDAQLGVLRAFEAAGRTGVPSSEVVQLVATQLRHVLDAVEATAREVTEGDYPRGPASLAEHLPVLLRLLRSRRGTRLGDGGLGHVVRVVEELCAGPGVELGLTAVLDRPS